MFVVANGDALLMSLFILIMKSSKERCCKVWPRKILHQVPNMVLSLELIVVVGTMCETVSLNEY